MCWKRTKGPVMFPQVYVSFFCLIELAEVFVQGSSSARSLGKSAAWGKFLSWRMGTSSWQKGTMVVLPLWMHHLKLDQEGGEGCENSPLGSVAALQSWSTWRRNTRLPWPITGTQLTCSCGLAWTSICPGSTWTSGVTDQRSSCSGYVPHHQPSTSERVEGWSRAQSEW